MRASLSKGFRSLFHFVVEAWGSKENFHWELLHCLVPGALAVAAPCSQPSSQQFLLFWNPKNVLYIMGAETGPCSQNPAHPPAANAFRNTSTTNFLTCLSERIRSHLIFSMASFPALFQDHGSWEAHGTWDCPRVFPTSCPALLKLLRSVAEFLHKSPCRSRHATGLAGHVRWSHLCLW